MPAIYRVSTEAVREGERFAFWRDAARTVQGLTEEWRALKGSIFHGEVLAKAKGPLQQLRLRSATTISRRAEAGIADRPLGAYMISRECGEISEFTNARTSIISRRNEFLVVDADTPCAMHAPGGVDCAVLLLPKALVDPHLATRMRPLGRALTARAGVDALVASYLHSLFNEWEAISEREIGPVAESLGRLIGVACGAALGEHDDALADARLVAAKRHVETHLASPRLSATTTAMALKISERTLYSLFERTGTTFAAHVRRRRLEECRAALQAEPLRPVTDIALAWGFGGMSSFYRGFQSVFGASPSDLREAARKDDGSGAATENVRPSRQTRGAP